MGYAYTNLPARSENPVHFLEERNVLDVLENILTENLFDTSVSKRQWKYLEVMHDIDPFYSHAIEIGEARNAL
jgi:hypothetical protein